MRPEHLVLSHISSWFLWGMSAGQSSGKTVYPGLQEGSSEVVVNIVINQKSPRSGD